MKELEWEPGLYALDIITNGTLLADIMAIGLTTDNRFTRDDRQTCVDLLNEEVVTFTFYGHPRTLWALEEKFEELGCIVMITYIEEEV